MAALFDMTARSFVLATFIGMAPATVIYVNFGRRIGTVRLLRDLLSPGVLIGLTGLGILMLMPAIYRQWSKRKSNSTAKLEGLTCGANGI